MRPDRAIKHFTTYDPVAKWTTGHVATRATAKTAAALLDKLIAGAPFRTEGIQVDGGSEFKADFEQACKDKGLTLYVLAPKRPQLNGAVERNQGVWRYEFYASFDLPHRIDKLQPLVKAFADRFNHHRPIRRLAISRTRVSYDLNSVRSLRPRTPCDSPAVRCGPSFDRPVRRADLEGWPSG